MLYSGLSVTPLFVLALLAPHAVAVPVWGQCGGKEWTGGTTCDAGTTCVVVNEFYFQCQPGTTTAAPTTSRATTTTTRTTTSNNPGTTGLAPLKSYFTSGRYFGLFTNQGRMTTAPAIYRTLAETHFNSATESNACKWETIEASQNSFNYGGCDYTANWINGLGGKFRGHALVWHSQLAGWVNNLKGTAVDNAMKNHISTIMKHYVGKVYAWDVVNEALNEDGSLRSSVFLTQIGTNYIEKAFTYARAADPAAKLYYNDYNLERAGSKQNGAYNLVRDLKAKGLIDGVGIQGHLDVGNIPDLAATIKRFASLGVDVALTEVDIGTKSQDFQGQARDYATVVSACVQEPRCVGITIGGVRDNESQYWRNGEYTLLWNESYQPKPAASAVATAAAKGT